MPRPSPVPLFLAGALALLVGASQARAACVTDQECANGSFCDGIERCVDAACQAGPPLLCDDGDPCTTDGCVPAAGCSHTDDACPAICAPSDDGARCSDGTACTIGDTCSGGTCLGTPLACDDGDPCTADTCDLTLGCVYVERADPPACLPSAQCLLAPDHVPCLGDGDPCTQDGCLEGACRVGLRQFARQCADADFCNGQEYCSPIKGCEPAPPLVCDDGDPCNGTETCDTASGCLPGTPATDGTLCDDALACTVLDHCSGGACGGAERDCGDANPSTTDLCLEPAGCLNCVTIADGRLGLTFPTPTKPGKFTIRGTLSPLGPFDPTTEAGVDLLLHDDAEVFQRSHVPATGFVPNAAGTANTFTDRTGTLAAGLQSLKIKTGRDGRPYKFSAKGLPAGPTFGDDASNSVTLVAGSECATARLTCALTPNGRVRKCK